MMNSLTRISNNPNYNDNEYLNERDEDEENYKGKLYRKYDNIYSTHITNDGPQFSNANTNFNSIGSSQMNELLKEDKFYHKEDVYARTPNVLYGNSNMIEYNENNYDNNDFHNSDNSYTYQKTSNSVKLEKQVSELQVVINELQKKNTMLQMELSDSNNKVNLLKILF
jgi:hypothetical protein